ncbi:MAG: phosphate signaling complex protein PhoU [Chloroflexia bacterium]|nr:phosphate signaling complex protein PhoU [Chloroflexia bacterium]
MMRESFDQKLRELEDDLVHMGGVVDQAIARSIEALKKQDVALAQEIIDNDDSIDQLQYDLEGRALILIATQQPLASDLRLIASIISVANELERIADYAEGIATLTLRGAGQPLLKPLIDIPRMAELSRDMLQGSLKAFVQRDLEWASQIGQLDDVVDNLYDQVYRELLIFMMEDPRTITRATYLLWVAHKLERIADRTTNICERILFMETGKQRDLNYPPEEAADRVAPDRT